MTSTLTVEVSHAGRCAWLALPSAGRRRRATASSMMKFVHCPNRDDLLNRQKLSVTFRTYVKKVELFTKSQVRFLTLTSTGSATIEKAAITQDVATDTLGF
mgnify:CR=1 FL=1